MVRRNRCLAEKLWFVSQIFLGKITCIFTAYPETNKTEEEDTGIGFLCFTGGFLWLARMKLLLLVMNYRNGFWRIFWASGDNKENKVP